VSTFALFGKSTISPKVHFRQFSAFWQKRSLGPNCEKC
jgi:hypothetical protein